MIEIVNGHRYKWELRKGRKLFHFSGCKKRFKLVGFYKLLYFPETIWTYRCQCSEVSFGT